MDRLRPAADVVIRRRTDVDLRAAFDDAATALGSTLDPAQRPAADALAGVGARMNPATRAPRRHRNAPRGVSLHGPVGRGKTWLVEVLTTHLPPGGRLAPARLRGRPPPAQGTAAHAGSRGGLDAVISGVLGGAGAVFLDEPHAHDPGDAMLQPRLVRSLPARGVVLPATSN